MSWKVKWLSWSVSGDEVIFALAHLGQTMGKKCLRATSTLQVATGCRRIYERKPVYLDRHNMKSTRWRMCLLAIKVCYDSVDLHSVWGYELNEFLRYTSLPRTGERLRRKLRSLRKVWGSKGRFGFQGLLQLRGSGSRHLSHLQVFHSSYLSVGQDPPQLGYC